MPNITLQDLTAIIHATSRSNNQFDLVHVETLLQTSEPIPPEMSWFVPNGSSIKPEIAEFFKANNIKMYPMSEQKILEGTPDIIEQAKQGNTDDVEKDASMLLLRSVMKTSNLELVTGTTNVYRIVYNYKIYPLANTTNTFNFNVCLPFDGLTVQAGGQIKMSIMLPLGAQVDPDATQGAVVGGQPIQELITPITNVGRAIVSFQYQNDPDFTIQYHY